MSFCVSSKDTKKSQQKKTTGQSFIANFHAPAKAHVDVISSQGGTDCINENITNKNATKNPAQNTSQNKNATISNHNSTTTKTLLSEKTSENSTKSKNTQHFPQQYQNTQQNNLQPKKISIQNESCISKMSNVMLISIFSKTKIDVKKFDIFRIDSIIKEQLSQRIDNVFFLQKDLDNALYISKHGIKKDRIMAKKNIGTLRRIIQDIQNTFEYTYYIFRTQSIIDDYRTSMSSKTSRSFVCLDKETSMKDLFKREELTNLYLSIAREYINVENFQQSTKKMCCPSCGSYDMRRTEDDDTTFVCYECYTEAYILDESPSFKDADRVNMCNRYTYSRKGHFLDAIKKHQGIQNIDQTIINNVASILIEEIKFHNIEPHLVTKNQLYMFLAERELNTYYDDLNLLHHIITGEPCPDISEYEAVLIEDFDEQERALDTVSALDVNDSRVNSLNVYYKLYKLLQRLGHRCRKDDFYILKTKTKEDEHDEKMRKAWDFLGWKWIETF